MTDEREAAKQRARDLRAEADALEASVAPKLGMTRTGQRTVDGVVAPCPQPFDDCRPGACNCDGIADHWKYWHTDPARRCWPDCDLPYSYEEA